MDTVRIDQNGAQEETVDLSSPCTSDIILEVRTGKMKKMAGLEIESGIDKTIRSGPVRVTGLGLEDDEHDLIFHGGVDKAIHGCKLRNMRLAIGLWQVSGILG